jgi:hypothetical protein
MTIKTLPDITGDNAKHQLSSSDIHVRALYFGVIGGSCRVGDVNTSATQGVQITALRTLQVGPDPGDFGEVVSLDNVYAYVPSGSTLTISYATAP